jgi:hypothetical protein
MERPQLLLQRRLQHVFNQIDVGLIHRPEVAVEEPIFRQGFIASLGSEAKIV